MSETVSLEWVGTTLRTIQAEQRAQRTEMAVMSTELGRMVTREGFQEAGRALLAHVAAFEARVESRLDHVNAQLAQLHSQLDVISRLLVDINRSRPEG